MIENVRGIEGSFSDVLIGLQYGDEGKAKIVDFLAPHYKIVARFNGGVNAGHTIVTKKGKLALRQVPSAVAYENTTLYIGSGCTISVPELVSEVEQIEKLGYSVKERLIISPYATLVLPHHILLDRMHGGEVGTTGNGIGPAYAERAFRMQDGIVTNMRAIDLVTRKETVIANADRLLSKIEGVSASQRAVGEELLDEFDHSCEQVQQYVAMRPTYLVDRVRAGANVLFEGAQSYMLDVTTGDVPYVTSSNTSIAAAYTGGDLPPKYHRRAFGVAKLIMSRVGNGPFASELGGERSREYCTKDEGLAHTRSFEEENFDPNELIASEDQFEVGRALRLLSGEYGTGSGRPRRVGSLDLQQLKQAIDANGIDELYLTKADCLVDYSRTKSKTVPILEHKEDKGALRNVIQLAAPSSPFTEARLPSELPSEVHELINLIEDRCGVMVAGVGVGPHRDQLILFDKTTSRSDKKVANE